MPADALIPIYDRLSRGAEHLETIKSDLHSYYGSDFSGLVGEIVSGDNGKDTTWSISGRIPWNDSRLPTIIGEFLHNVRSALDHLAWQLVIASGGTPQEMKTTFPILKAAPTLASDGHQPPPHVAGGVSPEALAIIENAQPYKLGALYTVHPLWVLHELWNIDKHRHVAPTQRWMTGLVIESGTPKFSYRLKTISFSEYGVELAIVPDDPSIDVDLRTTFRVMVEKPAELPLYEALVDALTAVRELVTACELACF